MKKRKRKGKKKRAQPAWAGLGQQAHLHFSTAHRDRAHSAKQMQNKKRNRAEPTWTRPKATTSPRPRAPEGCPVSLNREELHTEEPA